MNIDLENIVSVLLILEIGMSKRAIIMVENAFQNVPVLVQKHKWVESRTAKLE